MVSGRPEECYTLIEENALRIKTTISGIWENNIRSCHLLYWQSLRNRNIAIKHDTLLQEENIILPQWLQMKEIPNETKKWNKMTRKTDTGQFQD